MTTNPHRLPRTAVPSRYDLLLEPDLAGASFRGHVVVRLDVRETTNTLVCNAVDLVIASAVARTSTGDVRGTVALDAETERCTVTFAAPLPVGPTTLTMVFTGTLNDKLCGWYRSTYTATDGAAQVIATTQMEAADCRRAFPCWDEPDLKAVFSLTLVVDRDLTAISNGAEIDREDRPGGKVAVRFADTMAMSTYLVAMIVGRLDVTAPVDVGGVPLRVVHVPGRSHLTALALETAASCLRFFQTYYGIAYPGQKIDLVALPDFAAGAMENLGCITFRDNLLLLDPEQSTQAEQQQLVDVVAHELAHMWFGDLVTMRWWNGIWLNEAFATFMEVLATDDFRPEWDRWTSFSLERSVAFDVDGLRSSRPVEFEVVSPDEAEGMFDVLTYQKGGSLLRMLEQHLGPEVFRDGVREYLTTHAYGNTETSDLWDAIEAVAAAPVRRLMDSWIWQAGHPLITADLDGGDVVLRQQRFLYDGGDDDATQWVVPVRVRQLADGAERVEKVLLDGDEVRLSRFGPDAAVVANAGGHGFYRVSYAPELLGALQGPALSSLSTAERYGLVDDTWAGVVAGRTPALAFCQLALAFADETELAVWQILLAGLRTCDRMVPAGERTAFQGYVRALLTPALERLGWDRADGDSDLRAELRGVVIRSLAVLGNDVATIERARRTFADGSPDPEVQAACTTVVAATGDEADYDRFVEGYRSAPTPQERLRFLYALAEFPSAALLDRTLAFAFGGEVRTQNAPFLLNRCIAHRELGERAWAFVRQRWDDATKLFPDNLIVRMVDPVKLLVQPHQQAEVAAFFAEHPIPQAARTLDQVLERQRINVALAERDGAALGAGIGAIAR